MIKKLKTSGNGWELYFSKPILKLLGYDPKVVRLLITTQNSMLFVKPINEDEVSEYANNMVRRLQRSGGSYALYLPNPLIEVLNINPETDMIDIDITNNEFTLKKAE